MRVTVDTLELPETNELLAAVSRFVDERVASPAFAGVRDLRVRFRVVKGALLCIAAVGLSDGGLATSTATSASPLEAVADALDGLPDRIGRVTRISPSAGTSHAAVREQLRTLLDRA